MLSDKEELQPFLKSLVWPSYGFWTHNLCYKVDTLPSYPAGKIVMVTYIVPLVKYF